MEYLQHPEVIALLKASYEHGNREAHLALLTMYATGARVSQIVGDRHAKRPIEGLKGCDIIPDHETGGHRIRIMAAKRGKTRTYRVLVSPNPALDMRDLVTLAQQRGTSYLFGGLTRHYLHTLIKRFAKAAGLHVDMVHCHTIRHSTAMRVYERTQRIGAVSGYLAHSDPSAAYTYVQENDGKLADAAMAAAFAS
jgi:integrase/recombinase XerD